MQRMIKRRLLISMIASKFLGSSVEEYMIS